MRGEAACRLDPLQYQEASAILRAWTLGAGVEPYLEHMLQCAISHYFTLGCPGSHFSSVYHEPTQVEPDHGLELARLMSKETRA